MILASITSNWVTEDDGLRAIVQADGAAAAVKLHTQDAGPCTITCSFKQPLVRSIIHVVPACSKP
jgi:hypothetical protein